MGSPVFFNGNFTKSLKPNLNLFDQVYILSGAVDPTASATLAPKGSLYLNDSNGLLYRKLDSGTTTNWVAVGSGSAGDIAETSFSGANNQASAANVTGLTFSNSIVRAADVQVSVFINATSSIFEYFQLHLIQKGASWEMAQTSVGDSSGYTFTVTTAGQVQYTSPNSAGFVASTLKFRASTLSV